MRLTIRPAAQADLHAIGEFIAADNPTRSLSFINELYAVITDQIAIRPASFPARDDLHPGLRVARHGRYLIFFTSNVEAIDIVRIIHGARDMPRQFGL
jgi:toxin ParE1/3/4